MRAPVKEGFCAEQATAFLRTYAAF
jgi:hypothetical protein